ncbi:polar amino acid transport system substrate-binding protein [Actinokineospora auranticolor]|uniref:Polar amino acid transport system substrate-binding protein n=1 Tax=Actinokineospora auranticolor TaxID=155976 RepID=A0A2S6GRV3_9PSEU|nr:polar amino acid transport system substrate-binding protein [Actinokineospora auranticolor]
MFRLSPSRVAILLPTLALAVVTAGCGSSTTPASGGDSGAQVQLITAGKVTTCTGLPYKPFQYEENGKVIGFDVDLMDLVAKKLNATQEIVDTPFEGIQSGVDLSSGKCDLAAAGMTITDARKQNFDFSDPYFEATQAIVAKKGTPGQFEQLKGKKLGYQNGTTGQEYAQKNAPGVELVNFEDLGLELNAVETGVVDAAINDNGVVFDWVKDHPDFEVVNQFDTGEKYGIGVKKGNAALLKVINETIAEAKSSGEYDKIYQKWFGKKPGDK